MAICLASRSPASVRRGVGDRKLTCSTADAVSLRGAGTTPLPEQMVSARFSVSADTILESKSATVPALRAGTSAGKRAKQVAIADRCWGCGRGIVNWSKKRTIMMLSTAPWMEAEVEMGISSSKTEPLASRFDQPQLSSTPCGQIGGDGQPQSHTPLLRGEERVEDAHLIA